MKTKTAKMLPKTASEIQNGGLYAQRVRCGKSNCKCMRGENHTAHYFFSRRGGKLVKIYVRKSEVAAFSRVVRIAAEEREQRRQSNRSSARLLKRLREFAREYEQVSRLYKENHNHGQN